MACCLAIEHACRSVTAATVKRTVRAVSPVRRPRFGAVPISFGDEPMKRCRRQMNVFL